MAGRKNLNKNAISAFEEYGVQRKQTPKVEVIATSGPAHKPVFTAVSRLGDTEVCSEQGHSKHEARIKAAERALQMLSIQNVDTLGDSILSQVEQGEEEDGDLCNPVAYKDPVSALMEFAQFAKIAVSFDLISQEGPPHMPIFTMVVKLGDQICQSASGGSAKETKKRAACMALKKLKQDGSLQSLFPDNMASTGPVGKKCKSTLGVPGRNPVSVLNELAQKSSRRLRFESSQTGPPHKPVFDVWAVLGDEVFPPTRATSKKEGNVLAAETVLKILGERGQYVLPKDVPGQTTSTNNTMPSQMNHHDGVAAAAVRKVDELLLQTPESLVGRKVVAAIVMLDKQQRLYRVVSVGSGNRCIKGSHIRDDGTVLHDSHAEVLARRGFKRFMYWLLRSTDLSILVPSRDGRRRKFKDGISFHLYISTAPCGDGALFTHSDKGAVVSSCPGCEHNPVFSNMRTQGLLRVKQENGEGTIPVEAECAGQTYDGIQQGGRLRVMSCSDKICQWNVLGIQGALLSRLYEPVYLQSITLGNLFNAGHLARALCCRIDHAAAPLQSQLPCGYYVNHPDLGVASCQDSTRVVERARPLSINWCFGDKEPEITDGTIGQTVKTVDRPVGASRLCKQSLLGAYRQTIDSVVVMNASYKQIKLDSDEYNQAKMLLHRRLQEQRYGYWVCMPREVDRFQ